MKDILVTGANGLLGTNVIHALVAAGYNATGLLRRKDSFRGALSGSLELVEGDITSQGHNIPSRCHEGRGRMRCHNPLRRLHFAKGRHEDIL